MTHLDPNQAEAIARILTLQSHMDEYYVKELIEAAEHEFPGWTFTRLTDDAHFGDVVARWACSCKPNAHRAWPQFAGEIPPMDKAVEAWICPTHGAMWAIKPEQEEADARTDD